MGRMSTDQSETATPVEDAGGRSVWELDGVESGTVETNGVATTYLRTGSGRRVVFVHGLFMSATAWGPQVAELHEAFEVIAYDVRGHGRTGGSDVAS